MGKPKTKVEIQNAIRMLRFRVVSVDFESAKPLEQDFFNGSSTDLDFYLGFDELEKRHYSVQFHLEIENEQYEFRMEVSAVAIFEAEIDITEEDKVSFLFQQNSPAIAFPFLRSFVSTFTINCGIPPILLPTYNFAK